MCRAYWDIRDLYAQIYFQIYICTCCVCMFTEYVNNWETLYNMPISSGILNRLTRCWSFCPKLVTKSLLVLSIDWWHPLCPRIRYGRRYGRFMLARLGATFLTEQVCYGSNRATSTEGCDAARTSLTPGVPRAAEPSFQIWGGVRAPVVENDIASDLAVVDRARKRSPCRNGTRGCTAACPIIQHSRTALENHAHLGSVQAFWSRNLMRITFDNFVCLCHSHPARWLYHISQERSPETLTPPNNPSATVHLNQMKEPFAGNRRSFWTPQVHGVPHCPSGISGFLWCQASIAQWLSSWPQAEPLREAGEVVGPWMDPG